jgi:UDP-N-acetylmuramyl tripeptide synthase
MEKFMLEDTETRMILIKNPAGCNQVLNFLSNINSKTLFVVCLNDNYADGTDISWIWDVDFESLQKIEDNLTGVLVSGIRADEMAMRFKYAGIPEEKIKVIKDYEELIDEFTSQDAPVYIMPTYTAMMDLRAIVSKKFGYKNFWE